MSLSDVVNVTSTVAYCEGGEFSRFWSSIPRTVLSYVVRPSLSAANKRSKVVLIPVYHFSCSKVSCTFLANRSSK